MCFSYRLQLVSRDLPEAFANRREIQCQKQELKKSLENEIAERMSSLVDKVCYFSSTLHKRKVQTLSKRALLFRTPIQL